MSPLSAYHSSKRSLPHSFPDRLLSASFNQVATGAFPSSALTFHSTFTACTLACLAEWPECLSVGYDVEEGECRLTTAKAGK